MYKKNTKFNISSNNNTRMTTPQTKKIDKRAALALSIMGNKKTKKDNNKTVKN